MRPSSTNRLTARREGVRGGWGMCESSSPPPTPSSADGRLFALPRYSTGRTRRCAPEPTTDRPATEDCQAACSRLTPSVPDYSIIAVYFLLVLGIGAVARLSIKTDIDFFLFPPGSHPWDGFE
jgi:hypothetical protein